MNKDLPYIPMTDPPKQLDVILDFCDAWNGPVQVAYEGRELLLMPYAYYLERYCSGKEADQIRRELQKAAAAQSGN